MTTTVQAQTAHTDSQQPKKRQRQLHYNPHGRALFITMPKDGIEYGYYVEPITGHDLDGSRFRCYSLEKFRCQRKEGEPNEYAVKVDTEGGEHSCECKGWLRWGRCKHVDALRKLLQTGRLPS